MELLKIRKEWPRRQSTGHQIGKTSVARVFVVATGFQNQGHVTRLKDPVKIALEPATFVSGAGT